MNAVARRRRRRILGERRFARRGAPRLRAACAPAGCARPPRARPAAHCPPAGRKRVPTRAPRAPSRARRARRAARRSGKARRRTPARPALPGASWPLAARMPSAIGRSKRLESLGSSAGARLTVMRRAGNSKCAWFSAARTRSRASRTSVSGSPTMWNAGRPGPRCTSTVTSGASIPASARLATRRDRHRIPPQGGTLQLLVAFTFELGDARFELGELLLRALEQLLLHLEVLAQHQVEAREPRGEQRLQVLLDVLRRRIAERLADALVQLVEKSLVDHGREVPHRSRARRGARMHQLSAPRAPVPFQVIVNQGRNSLAQEMLSVGGHFYSSTLSREIRCASQSFPPL